VNDTNDAPQINWSVWDNNPIVSWSYQGNDFAVTLETPPISVVDLPFHTLVAIIGSYDDFGLGNLLLYSYDGILKQKLAAPDLGPKAHFGRVSENRDRVSAVVGFYDNGEWVEKEGYLDLKHGTMERFHRSY
jgi:hypothetical protein